MICLSLYIEGAFTLGRKVSFYSFFKRLVIFSTEIIHGALSLCFALLTLKTCGSSANNWGRSYNVLYVLCVITFLPYRQLDDWLQSRSQDIILQYFNFYGWAFSRSPGILLTSSVITLENIVRVGLTVQELHPIEKV